MNKAVFFSFIVILLILLGPHVYKTWEFNHKLQQNISSSRSFSANPETHVDNQAGQVTIIGVEKKLTEDWINRYQQSWPLKKKAGFYTWTWHGIQNVTATAIGLDNKAHFVNSYLVNYKPFETENLWIPLYTLAITKKYQYDHLQYSGMPDLWQNSRQAFFYPRGDCEDHAIILADWLISMNEDARVAVGKYKGEGHAWVILFKNGSEYLLEATSKKRNKTNLFPLAMLKTDYEPEMMFNREKFWFKQGDIRTTSYSGHHWKIMSHFSKNYILN
jgi:hypothetical protein